MNFKRKVFLIACSLLSAAITLPAQNSKSYIIKDTIIVKTGYSKMLDHAIPCPLDRCFV